MARMSVDDRIARDPRITRLAKLIDRERYWVVGVLVCAVWPICYDRECAVVAIDDVDAAAELNGFAMNMVSVGLATEQRGGVRIAGANERIEYLKRNRIAGRAGGLASGKSRSKSPTSNGRLSTASSTAQAPTNLPDTVPDSAPSPVPESVPDGVIALPGNARAPAKRRTATARPIVWQPNEVHEELATKLGLSTDSELEKFTDFHLAKGSTFKDWDAAFRTWLRNAKRFAPRKTFAEQKSAQGMLVVTKSKPESSDEPDLKASPFWLGEETA